jgi:transposase InsO family protein
MRCWIAWLVERRGRLRRRVQGTALSLGQRPNELWFTDYKGEFLLGNGHYCYPLTVTDQASRFLLCCEALSSTREDFAFAAFERLFQERGLPAAIRSDNGVPSLPLTPSSISANWPHGGCGWALASSGSNLDIRSRTAATSVCI